MASNISYALHLIRDYMKLFGILKLLKLITKFTRSGNNTYVVCNSLTYNIYHLTHKVVLQCDTNCMILSHKN